MNIQVLMTGSDGNCSLITHKDTAILIDAGFKTKTKMEEVINPILKQYKIDAILVTHEHKDHLSNWTGRLSIEYDIPLFVHEKHYELDKDRKSKVFSYIDKRKGEELEANTIFITEDVEFTIKDLTITPFSVYHDAHKTLAFSFNDNKLVYLTDCGFLSNKIKSKLLKAENLAIEANFDLNRIMDTERFWKNKIRTLGQFGHLSVQEAMDFLQLAKKRGVEYKNVITLHISNTNNDIEFVENKLKELNLDNTSFYVARRESNPLIEL